MAVLSGILLSFAETWINWGQWQWWPWWLVDYVAAIMLVSGGLSTLFGREWGKAALSAGWAFCLGMGWMSLAGNIAGGVDPNRDASVAGLYVVLISFGMIWSLLGLSLAIFGSSRRLH